MRSTGPYPSWLTTPSAASSTRASSPWANLANEPIVLTYLGEQARRAGWARPGAVLDQRYELESPLAARTPGVFWHARRLSSAPGPEVRREALVTLQLLDPALVEDPPMLDAFFQEARAAGAIDHPHVARVLDHGVDYGLDGGIPFLVLEHLVGETLADRLVAAPRLGTSELARLVGEAARGLEALHEWGLIHRRLDPAHLFLSGEGTARRTQLLFAIDQVFRDNLSLVHKLSHHLSGDRSWGSRSSREHLPGNHLPGDHLPGDHLPGHHSATHQLAAHHSTAQQRHGAAMPGASSNGRSHQRLPAQDRLETAEYQSPEQLLGHDPIDARSDLWSLAVIAFEAATGMPAFSGSSLGDRLVQICSGEPNLAPADVPLPPGFTSWFQQGVRKPPAERFASARQMAEALQGILPPF